MNRRQKIIVSVTGIFIVLLILIGLTYAYFLTRITGNSNPTSISVTTANLELVYGDGITALLTSNTPIEPGKFSSSKDFTVTNNGNALTDYAVTLEDFSIQYANDTVIDGVSITAGTVTKMEYPSDMKMTITCVIESDNEERNGQACGNTNGTLPTENSILLTNSIEVDDIHKYELTLTYVDSGIDQSADMNKTIKGKIDIIDPKSTIDLEGTVATYQTGDYVEINSTPIKSEIVDGNYKLIGVEPGSHTLYVKYKDASGNVQTRGSETLTIKKGVSASVSGTTITFTDASRVATVDVTESYGITVDETLKELKSKLAEKILLNAKTAKNTNDQTRTIYNDTFDLKDIAKVSAETDRMLLLTEDDYGTSYVFRGNVKDNYVNFSGMCWKIIRIEGDGSIKLILEDQYTICNDNEDTDGTGLNDYSYSGNWNIAKGNYGYVYEYVRNSNNQPSANKYLIAYKYSENQPSMKQKLDEWLSQSGIDTKNLKKDNWCLGNTANAYDSSGTLLETSLDDLIFDGAKFYYDIAKRLQGIGESRNATLKCGKNDSVANEYIGAITADEVAFAGGHSITENFQYYLINSYQVEDWLSFWTLSPAYFEEDETRAYVVSFAGTIDPYVVGGENDFRPSITLTSSTEYSGGSGMQDDPYIIN